MSLRCHWLWGYVVWFKVWRCGGPKNCSVLLQYYKVLRQYHNVLPSTTTYYSGTTLKCHSQCAEQQEAPSNFTKYFACHTKSMSSVICVTYETSFPMSGASKVTLQPHQILRLPRKLEAQDFSRNSLKCFRQYKDDSAIIRPHPTTSDNILRSGYLPKCHDVLRLPRETLLIRYFTELNF